MCHHHTVNEQMFDMWERHAVRVRRVLEVDMSTKSVAEPLHPTSRQALDELRHMLAEHLGQHDAEWSVTRWYITHQSLRSCIQKQLTEGHLVL